MSTRIDVIHIPVIEDVKILCTENREDIPVQNSEGPDQETTIIEECSIVPNQDLGPFEDDSESTNNNTVFCKIVFSESPELPIETRAHTMTTRALNGISKLNPKYAL